MRLSLNFRQNRIDVEIERQNPQTYFSLIFFRFQVDIPLSP